MADDTNKKHAKGVDKLLVNARERFKKSKKTIPVIRDAVLDVPGVTVFDFDRIFGQLYQRRAEFKHAPSIKAFRAALVVWAVRQAQLIVMLREILKEPVYYDATLLFTMLPNYNGEVNTDALRAWVIETNCRKNEADKLLFAWMRDHSAAVRRGLRGVLTRCRDLDGCIDDVEDQLFSEIWMHVAGNAATYLELEKAGTLRRKLRDEGKWNAMAWKKSRERAIEKGDYVKKSERFLIGFDGMESQIKGSDGEVEMVGVALEDMMDPNADLNPIIIKRLPWTKAAFDREVCRVVRANRAGPFRADDRYDADEQLLAVA